MLCPSEIRGTGDPASLGLILLTKQDFFIGTFFSGRRRKGFQFQNISPLTWLEGINEPGLVARSNRQTGTANFT